MTIARGAAIGSLIVAVIAIGILMFGGDGGETYHLRVQTANQLVTGNEVKVGQAAPDFKVNYFEGGMKEIKLADLKGKPTLLSVVPSLTL